MGLKRCMAPMIIAGVLLVLTAAAGGCQSLRDIELKLPQLETGSV